MQAQLRPAQRADTAAIARLWHQGWHDGHAAYAPPELTAFRTLPRFTQRTRDALHLMRVAAQGPKVLGMTLLRKSEVEQVYIAPEARGAGLAATLLDDAEACLARAGHRRAWLACATGNARARRFYEKRGWTVTATEEMVIETAAGPTVLSIWRLEKPLPPPG